MQSLLEDLLGIPVPGRNVENPAQFPEFSFLKIPDTAPDQAQCCEDFQNYEIPGKMKEYPQLDTVVSFVSIAMTAPGTTTAVTTADAVTSRTVRAAQSGDREACEELARSYQKSAFLFALQLTGQRDDALELAQEAMLRFFRTLGRFDADRPVRPWLLRIVRNLVRDRGRRLRVRRTVALQYDPEAMAIDPPDPSPNPEQRAAQTELQQLLWQAMAELPPHYREVVALRDYMDLSYREIATALKIPTGTVMSRLHRARTLLRDSVSKLLAREVRDD